MKITVRSIWAFLRLPILAAGLYLFRDHISIWIEKYFNLAEVIEGVVYLISTASTRFILYSICVAGLWAAHKLTSRAIKSETGHYALFILISFTGFFILFENLLKTPQPLARTLIAATLLAVNTLPPTWLNRLNLGGNIINVLGATGIVINELLFPQVYFLWLTDTSSWAKTARKWSWLGGVLAASLVAIFLLTPYNNQRILTLGERLHVNPAVAKFSDEGYNWIEYNPEQNRLYAVGHNTAHLMAYDTNHLNLPPLRSQTKIGRTQSFGFNSNAQEIYIYKADTKELIYLDARTLEITRRVPVPALSPGDVWIHWQPKTDSITIASEADRETGTPTVMVARKSGEVIASIPFPLVGTNVAFDMDKDIFYFSSFRDTYLVAWDLNTHKVLQKVETSPRTDRLIYSPLAHEVLVASTQDGAILRYDADTLEYKGQIDASLGDRTLSLDSKRNLLLVGNFINNYMQVIDLSTGKRVARYYIGPWIRTIAIDEKAGIAYVSTAGNLFTVNYVK